MRSLEDNGIGVPLLRTKAEGGDKEQTGAFGGSAARLVMQALAAKKASPEELAEIRELLAEQEGKQERV